MIHKAALAKAAMEAARTGMEEEKEKAPMGVSASP
jgi:hypothetical protein